MQIWCVQNFKGSLANFSVLGTVSFGNIFSIKKFLARLFKDIILRNSILVALLSEAKELVVRFFQ